MAQGMLEFQTLRYKLKSFGSMVFGIIVLIGGIVLGLYNHSLTTVLVGIILGIIILGLSFLSFRSARALAETRAGMRGYSAQRRLFNREEKNNIS